MRYDPVKLLDESERLQALEEFQALTERQKRMCYEHVHFPELNKSEIAKKLLLGKGEVYTFFNSRKWEVINAELAKQQIRELCQLSIKTIRQALLNGTWSVKLDAAIRVLENNDIMRPRQGPRTVKQDNKMVVVWNEGEDKSTPAPITIDQPNGSETDGQSAPTA